MRFTILPNLREPLSCLTTPQSLARRVRGLEDLQMPKLSFLVVKSTFEDWKSGLKMKGTG